MQVGMVFAMIITIVIIGLVLVFGFQQIQSFFCLGSIAQTNKMVADVEALTEELFVLSKGSAKTYRVSLPADGTVCFINETHPGPHPYEDTRLTWNPDRLILEQFLQNPDSASYGSNVWIHRCGDALGQGHSIDFLSPSKSFCAPSGEELFLENKGSSVDISVK